MTQNFLCFSWLIIKFEMNNSKCGPSLSQPSSSPSVPSQKQQAPSYYPSTMNPIPCKQEQNFTLLSSPKSHLELHGQQIGGPEIKMGKRYVKPEQECDTAAEYYHMAPSYENMPTVKEEILNKPSNYHFYHTPPQYSEAESTVSTSLYQASPNIFPSTLAPNPGQIPHYNNRQRAYQEEIEKTAAPVESKL